MRTCSIALLIALVTQSSIADEKLSTLIIDGQNNHRWMETTPVIRDILEQSGRFEVDVMTAPPKGSNMDYFQPAFSNYAVVVSNYNGDLWAKNAQDRFVKYVRGGGGFVSIHAANNAFPEWKEYNEIIGLGGWGGRSERHGPYVFFRDGGFERDYREGRGGTHGARRPFVVNIRNTEHPITRGLPTEWKHQRDELYGLLRGPAANLTVLATAHSRPKNYEPEHEPQLMTVEYGKGRTFHTTLGHDVQAMSCTGFAVTLQRGTEWAATGKVTLTDIPADFPSAEEVSVRETPPPSEAVKAIMAADTARRAADKARRNAEKKRQAKGEKRASTVIETGVLPTRRKRRQTETAGSEQ